jgi:large subunit ribosomal protein L18
MPISKDQQRTKRHRRVRRAVIGTPERPRLQIHRTLHHLYAFVVDDSKGHTVASASTRDAGLAEGLASRTNVDAAKRVGQHHRRRVRSRRSQVPRQGESPRRRRARSRFGVLT